MAHLENKAAGTKIDLAGSTLVLGSEAGCGAVLTGDGVSPEHAEVRAGDGEFTVIDLESRAGTRVNGRYVNQHTLIEGDVIQIGDHELTFRAGVVARAAPPPAAVPAARPVRSPAKAGPRKSAPARGGARPAGRAAAAPSDEELAAYDAEAARRERQAAKRANSKRANVVFLAIPTLLVLAFVVFKMLPSEPINTRVAGRMLELDKQMEWAAMIEASKEAVPTNDHT